MRITHISRQYLPGIGGLESAIAALAAEQRAAGHVVRVVTLNRIFARPTLNLADREIIDGIEVVRIPYWGSSRYPIAPSVLRHLGDADIVHVHAIDFFFDFMALTRFFHGKSLVATTHGGFFHTSFASTAKKIWFSTMTRLSSTAYSAIVSCSPSDHDMIQTLSPGTSRLIENGVDTRKFRGLADSRSTSIIYFGRMAPNKGLFQLLKWFSQVALRDPAWTLTIAGAPGGTSVASLEEDAHDLGIESRVRIVDSPSDEQLKTLIAGSSVYACASLHEGFGIAAVEAASAGLFPVLSRLPAFEENLRRMETGLLIDFDMPVEGAARFLAAWADWTAPRRDRMIARASAEFDWSRAANAHEALYGQIVPPRRQIGHAVNSFKFQPCDHTPPGTQKL